MAFIQDGVNIPYQQYSREGNAAAWMVKAFQRSFGRGPTNNEMAMFLPVYLGSDKNITDTGQGDAAVARYYAQQNPNEDAKKGAPEKYGDIDAAFTQYLGRNATQEEKDHFGTLLASGQYSAYDIGNILQNLPENVKRQDEEFRKTTEAGLKASDERYFTENILPSVQRSFAQSGRSFDSSGFSAALASEAGKQNREREAFLTNLTAKQYEGNKDRAYTDYWRELDYNRGRSDTLADRNQMRLYELENYNIQKNAYDDYLKRYGKRSGMGGGAGTLIGAGIGAAVAGGLTGGMGAGQGAMLGAQLGGAGGSFWDSY